MNQVKAKRISMLYDSFLAACKQKGIEPEDFLQSTRVRSPYALSRCTKTELESLQAIGKAKDWAGVAKILNLTQSGARSRLGALCFRALKHKQLTVKP